MAEQIALEVTRFSPERDKAPSVQSFDVPLRKEWVVLDATMRPVRCAWNR
jgi:fumarate reductase iron-sulfur subunit